MDNDLKYLLNRLKERRDENDIKILQCEAQNDLINETIEYLEDCLKDETTPKD